MKTITLKNGTEVPVYFSDEDNPTDFPDTRVTISPEPFCEHCMELEPYDLMFFDGGCSWCESCVDHPMTEDPDVMAYLKRWEKEEKTKYFNGRLRGLGEGPIDDNGEWDGPDEDPDGTGFDEHEERISVLEDQDQGLETRLEALENDLTDLAERLKKIETFLREKDMHDRPDVLTLDGPPRWDD